MLRSIPQLSTIIWTFTRLTDLLLSLGDDDKKYLARAASGSGFAPGIPQVYLCWFSWENDLELQKTLSEGRNINCHYYSNEESHKEVKRPAVQALLKLFSYRNQSVAFDLDGTIEVNLLMKIASGLSVAMQINQSPLIVINPKELTYS